MTLGEMAQMINGEGWLANGIICDLIVIPCEGYAHSDRWFPTIAPSPNLPTDESIALYPSLCLFEPTEASIGRGTPNPFECIGFPGIPENEDQNRQRYIDRIQRNLPTNDQQGAFVPPPVQQRPSPAVPPTTQASAVPSPAPAPASSGPVDRTRYAALFPNDSISGMMKMRRGGIASLMR